MTSKKKTTTNSARDKISFDSRTWIISPQYAVETIDFYLQLLSIGRAGWDVASMFGFPLGQDEHLEARIAQVKLRDWITDYLGSNAGVVHPIVATDFKVSMAQGADCRQVVEMIRLPFFNAVQHCNQAILKVLQFTTDINGQVPFDPDAIHSVADLHFGRVFGDCHHLLPHLCFQLERLRRWVPKIAPEEEIKWPNESYAIDAIIALRNNPNQNVTALCRNFAKSFGDPRIERSLRTLLYDKKYRHLWKDVR
jgi:hypothetical protein